MEADSVDFEAWKGMEDISDDDIEQIYENDAENFFLRIQSFEQDLNEKLSNRGQILPLIFEFSHVLKMFNYLFMFNDILLFCSYLILIGFMSVI